MVWLCARGPSCVGMYKYRWVLTCVTEETATAGRGCSCGVKQEEESHPRPASHTKGYTIPTPPPIGRAQANATKDLEELSLGTTMKTHFPNPDDILNFELTIDPDEGMYKGGRFRFDFKINQNFPHDPPKVKCTQKIYHPNIDLEGNVCLNILREDWKPVLNLNAVVVGLQVCCAASLQ